MATDTGLAAYIASSFSLKDRVEWTHAVLSGAGIAVPDVWWVESKEQADLKVIDVPDAAWYQHPTVVQRAQRHWRTIRDCDVFVLVCPPNGETKKFNGANLELGYAFAHGLDCYALGRLERSAMYIGPDGEAVTQVDSADELLSRIRGGRDA